MPRHTGAETGSSEVDFIFDFKDRNGRVIGGFDVIPVWIGGVEQHIHTLFLKIDQAAVIEHCLRQRGDFPQTPRISTECNFQVDPVPVGGGNEQLIRFQEIGMKFKFFSVDEKTLDIILVCPLCPRHGGEKEP